MSREIELQHEIDKLRQEAIQRDTDWRLTIERGLTSSNQHFTDLKTEFATTTVSVNASLIQIAETLKKLPCSEHSQLIAKIPVLDEKIQKIPPTLTERVETLEKNKKWIIGTLTALGVSGFAAWCEVHLTRK
jgi:hypothetical protein